MKVIVLKKNPEYPREVEIQMDWSAKEFLDMKKVISNIWPEMDLGLGACSKRAFFKTIFYNIVQDKSIFVGFQVLAPHATDWHAHFIDTFGKRMTECNINWTFEETPTQFEFTI